jgi:hypothetical protein
MLADIDHLQQVRIQACPTNRPLKEGFVGSMTAPGNDHPVYPVLFDGRSNLGLSFLETAVANPGSMNHIG